MSQTESKIKMDSPQSSPTANNNNSSWKGGAAANNSYENGVKPETGSANNDQATTSSSSDSHTGPMNSFNGNGPDPAKLKTILDRTGYTHQVTAGQRKYGGPPPDWPKEQAGPQAGCEVFVGKIPREVFEDELIPLFEKIGKIWDLRLMVDPTTSQSRGYGFITYCNKADAQKAVTEMDGHKIRKATLKVNISVPNVRLFVGNIPKIMSKEQIFAEFEKVTEGLVEVITYSSPDDRKKNRGFCFLEFDSHKNASSAKRKLSQSGMKMFKCDILVDWADPQEEPDAETMSKVKVLYVRNLTQEVNESQLKQLFEEYGSIERVKKIKDYAFVHFDDRDHALEAMDKMNGKDFCGSAIEISLAKPPSDRKKKEEVLRNRERRMLNILQQKQLSMFSPYPQSGVSTPATAAVAAAAAARTFRPPLAMVPPMPTPAMIMSAAAAGPVPGGRGGKHRFNAPVNPLMSAMSMNRPGQPMWSPMMYAYDSPEMWYAAAAASGARPQFGNFPNMAPGWPYGFPNGQPHLMPFGPGGDSGNPGGNSGNNSGNASGNNRNSNSGNNQQNRNNRNNHVNGNQSNNNNNNNNRKYNRKNNSNTNSNAQTSQSSSTTTAAASTTQSSSSPASSAAAGPTEAPKTPQPTTNGQASSSSGPSTPKK